MKNEVDYLQEFSPVNMNGKKLEFCDETEHVGVIRSVHGNLPNILNRISAHKKAVAAVLHTGAARHHRANPVAGLRLKKVYGFSVLSRHWSANPNGHCLFPSCNRLGISEDVEHILLYCPSLSKTRASLAKFTLDYSRDQPHIQSTLLTYKNPTNPLYVQFLLDCSVIPEVISLTQVHGKDTLFKLLATLS